MNFRKLLTYLTVGTAAVIPFAGAQNPTILQGNYITNVFGQSNFVLNPNAQTNVANVTNATRVNTTPLVATSEFNLNLTSGTFATWTLRAFDSGMKGQNCEARFTYRGFATATTKAEIVQNSLVVASLTLTPSTDPRIASINFPCGDLANATTFRIAQTTANMTTVTPNEIGGIYVGLATNQANVAQAELIGTLKFGTNCTWSTTSSTWNAPSDATCTTTATGNVAAVSGVKSAIQINDTRAGNYYVVWSGGSFQRGQIATYQWCGAKLTDQTTEMGGYVDAPNNTNTQQAFTMSGMFSYSTSGTRTINLEMKSSDNTTSCLINTSTNDIQASVYRFPLSSELVVTPERQNTFAGVNFNASGFVQSQGIASTSWAKLTYSTNITRNPFGKAFVETNNDISVTIKSLPVGTYRVVANGLVRALANGSGNQTSCAVGISDSATPTNPIIASHINVTGDATSTQQEQYGATVYGVFTNTSLQDKTFYVVAKRIQGAGSCVVGTNSGDYPFVLSVEPLDQPSNSALYVQGPVKASATGAAIAAGYVGEVKTGTFASNSTTSNNTFIAATSSITLEPGTWLITWSISASWSASGTGNLLQARTRIRNTTDSTNAAIQVSRGLYNISYADQSAVFGSAIPVSVTATKTFRAEAAIEQLIGTFSGTFRTDEGFIYAIRLN